jgi:hypothetical protein
VDPEDFKSFCRALTTSEVGSIPTRSRHLWKVTKQMACVGGVALIAGLLLMPFDGASAVLDWAAGPGSAAAPVAAPNTTQPDNVHESAAPEDSVAEESAAPVAAPDMSRPETVPGSADSTDTPAEEPLMSAADETTDPGPVRKGPSPKGAVLRSALYPGWGQLANGKPYKACVVFGVEVYFLGVAVLSSRRAQDLLDSSRFVTSGAELADLEQRYADYVDRRNAHLWWLGAAILYSMLDAYVDASLTEVEEGLSKPPPFYLESMAGEDGALRFGIGARF